MISKFSQADGPARNETIIKERMKAFDELRGSVDLVSYLSYIHRLYDVDGFKSSVYNLSLERIVGNDDNVDEEKEEEKEEEEEDENGEKREKIDEEEEEKEEEETIEENEQDEEKIKELIEEEKMTDNDFYIDNSENDTVYTETTQV